MSELDLRKITTSGAAIRLKPATSATETHGLGKRTTSSTRVMSTTSATVTTAVTPMASGYRSLAGSRSSGSSPAWPRRLNKGDMEAILGREKPFGESAHHRAVRLLITAVLLAGC